MLDRREQAWAEIRKLRGYEAVLNALDSVIVTLGEKPLSPDRL